MNKSIITDQLSMDLEKSLDVASNLGYRYAEIHSLWNKTIEELSIPEAYKAKDLLDSYNMELSCVSSTVYFMCPLYEGDNLTSFSSEFLTVTGNTRDHIEYLKKATEIAHILNCNVVRVFPFRAPMDNRLIGRQEDIKYISDKLWEAAEAVEGDDIVLALENCPHSYLPKGYLTQQVVKTLDTKRVKLLWDAGNSFRAPQERLETVDQSDGLSEELEMIYQDIAHVHLKDYQKLAGPLKEGERRFIHKPLGKGDIDIASLLNFLKDVHYEGAVSLESEVNFDETIESMNYLNSIL